MQDLLSQCGGYAIHPPWESLAKTEPTLNFPMEDKLHIDVVFGSGFYHCILSCGSYVQPLGTENLQEVHVVQNFIDLVSGTLMAFQD